MTTNNQSARVVIALMESSSVTELWHATMKTIGSSSAELIALFLHDERWQRAASLPFTTEISSVGGGATDFTLQRADQLLATTASRLRARIEELASEAGLSITFEVLPESDRTQAQVLVGSDDNLLIGPSVLVEHPIYEELTQLDLRILLVDSDSNQE